MCLHQPFPYPSHNIRRPRWTPTLKAMGFDNLAIPLLGMLVVARLLLLVLLRLLFPLLQALDLLWRTKLFPHGIPKCSPALRVRRLLYCDRVVTLVEEVCWYLLGALTLGTFEIVVFQHAIERSDTLAGGPGTCMMALGA